MKSTSSFIITTKSKPMMITMCVLMCIIALIIPFMIVVLNAMDDPLRMALDKSFRIIRYVLIGVIIFIPLFIINTLVQIRSYCDVYEGMLIGRTTPTKFLHLSTQQFELTYDQIQNVSTGNQMLIINTAFETYHVWCVFRKTEILHEIRVRMHNAKSSTAH